MSDSKALSFNMSIRPETSLWCKTRSIHIRLGIDPKDIRDYELEDFITEAMADVQGDLDLLEIDYTAWTKLSLVPILVRIAVMYKAIAILTARKVDSFKTRLVPSVGPMRYDVLERDSSKAIEYFESKSSLALEKYSSGSITGGGSGGMIISSTEDEEPIFDMTDLQDKVTGTSGETSWYHWLLGHS